MRRIITTVLLVAPLAPIATVATETDSGAPAAERPPVSSAQHILFNRAPGRGMN